ncbi:MAG: 23S rRNA (uracil(1939)-C(5))-methyltransferase RlmD [Gammaproteobacteria bacterium]|nr:23S rRNA (uracil(1939)-C(5))-methyltransferase RlmD [Gammaproteobacteria bacterium]
MGRSRRRNLPTEPVTCTIESMAEDGRGLVHIEGKPVLVHGALPGERVSFRYSRVSRRQDEGLVEHVLEASPDRAQPRCDRFGICGGCSLQHQLPQVQIKAKQTDLMEAFFRCGELVPEKVLSPLFDESPWGYRTKARLGVKYVVKKERVLVGFRERGSGFVTDTDSCPVLAPRVARLHRPLADLIESWSIRDQVPQIEVVLGETDAVLVFRVLEAPSTEDLVSLKAFGREQGILPFLQEGGAETIRSLSGEPPDLYFSLPAEDLKIRFQPGDFTQVNMGVNRLMVDRAVALLDPSAADRVLDLFCGLGNFTLPLAKRAGEVIGVEGDEGLVSRARENACSNNIENARFLTADLYGDLSAEPWMGERFGLALLDPPRSGALDVVGHLPRLGVNRLVYVSCNPETLARDSEALVHQHGYRLRAAGVMDMFPHTHHVESMALFELPGL